MKYLFILFCLTALAFAGTIHPDLQNLMDSSSNIELIPVFILAHGELDAGWIDAATVDMTRSERQEFVVDALKMIAETSQDGIIEDLEIYSSDCVRNIVSLWLSNAVYCEATPSVILQISLRADVSLIEMAAHEDAGLIEPVDVHPSTHEELDKAITWSVTQINADDVWALGYNGTGVIVGVIDTGVDYNHPDLHNNMWHDTGAGYHYGWDFYDGDNDPMDTYGHGTHCSGSVCGDGTQGTETGVAPGATLMAIRINYYYGGESTWIQGMEFGADNGASVLSMSLGSTHGNTALRTANENLLTAGVFHSVAAANSGPGAGTILSPGDSPPPWFHPDQTYHGGQSAVVTAGATNSSDVIASFSSRGPVTWWTDYTGSTPLIDPDICAPGVNVVSTQWTGGYTTMSGTSMATPHIAGVAALMLDANDNLSVAQIDSLMEVTALELGAGGKDNTYGAGRVDAYQAVQAALWVGVADTGEAGQPADLILSPVSPNPVNGFATFEICTSRAGTSDISVFDISGRRVASISSSEVSSGTHAYNWMVPSGIGNGVYFVRASVDGRTVSSRMTIIR
ncbi:MAG: S8 family serine peptidase [Candidatus Aegiribacteria sp.]|nr:S8 family serine peptidase [Candidatus Aegiribacteria sp.]